jgi:hypothetical protein
MTFTPSVTAPQPHVGTPPSGQRSLLLGHVLRKPTPCAPFSPRGSCHIADIIGRMYRYCRSISAEYCCSKPWPCKGIVCQNWRWTRPHHHNNGRWRGFKGRIPRGVRQFRWNGVLRNAVKFRPPHKRWTCSVCCDRTKNADAMSGDEQHNGSWQRRKPNLRRGSLGD